MVTQTISRIAIKIVAKFQVSYQAAPPYNIGDNDDSAYHPVCSNRTASSIPKGRSRKPDESKEVCTTWRNTDD